MRKSRFSEAQILAVLKEGEGGVPVPELLRKHGISRNHLLQLEGEVRGDHVARAEATAGAGRAENTKLKRMYAELALENTAIKDLFETKL